MSAALYSVLLVGALLLWWLLRQQGATTVTICRRCGDLVEHTPGLPAVCPSCGALLW